MKIVRQIQTIKRQAREFFRSSPRAVDDYPREVVDLIVFHKLHVAMDMEKAWKSYRQLKSEFVDWNEVRVSSLREIQEQLSSADDSLELAVFVKSFLEFLHSERQRLNLELLSDENLTEIRRYLRQIKGIEPATVGLILLLRKDHPIVPLSSAMEQSLLRIGVVRKQDTRDRKEKRLYELLGPEQALASHHFLLEHARQTCPPNEGELRCRACRMRNVCKYYAAFGRKNSSSVGSNSRALNAKSTPARTTTNNSAKRGLRGSAGKRKSNHSAVAAAASSSTKVKTLASKRVATRRVTKKRRKK